MTGDGETFSKEEVHCMKTDLPSNTSEAEPLAFSKRMCRWQILSFNITASLPLVSTIFGFELKNDMITMAHDIRAMKDLTRFGWSRKHIVERQALSRVTFKVYMLPSLILPWGSIITKRT